MPEEGLSFGESLLQQLQRALLDARPDLEGALRIAASILTIALIVCVLRTFSGNAKHAAELCGTVAAAGVLLQSTHSMIYLGIQTVQEIGSYGKLLLPVLTAAVAAQGGTATSAALYAGTMGFSTLLGSIISEILLPCIYCFLALSAANSVFCEDILKKMRDLLKSGISWTLKTILTVYTTFMGISGVVSGTTDAAALKATKLTISTFVPVVGGILSDASEAVLVSAGLAKNAAGIYGILAMIALCLSPFVKIGIQYLTLKATAAASSIFCHKGLADLIDDFSTAMGFLLAMTGAVCLLFLISAVCFMKGVG